MSNEAVDSHDKPETRTTSAVHRTAVVGTKLVEITSTISPKIALERAMVEAKLPETDMNFLRNLAVLITAPKVLEYLTQQIKIEAIKAKIEIDYPKGRGIMLIDRAMNGTQSQ